jgi:hypothetical protein
MSDLVGVFETEKDAESFCKRSFDSELFVEDMFSYLEQPSPHIPTEEEHEAEIQARRRRHEEAQKDPINRAISEMSRRLARDLYGNGEPEE